MQESKTLSKLNRVSLKEIGKEYTFRFMPDRDDLIMQKIIKFQMANSHKWYYSHIMHVFYDGQIRTYKMQKMLYNMIGAALKGYIGTPDGRVICSVDHEIDGYYASPDLNNITLWKDEEEENDKDLVWFTDMVVYPPRNPLDIRADIGLNFTINSFKSGEFEHFKFDNLRWKIIDPLYKEGDDKTAILRLYDGIDTLAVAAESEKNYMSEQTNLWRHVQVLE